MMVYQTEAAATHVRPVGYVRTLAEAVDTARFLLGRPPYARPAGSPMGSYSPWGPREVAELIVYLSAPGPFARPYRYADYLMTAAFRAELGGGS